MASGHGEWVSLWPAVSSHPAGFTHPHVCNAGALAVRGGRASRGPGHMASPEFSHNSPSPSSPPEASGDAVVRTKA